MAQDYYKELGIDRNADADGIRKAYRKLAAELHPDRNPGKKAIEDRFKRVNSAYHVLSDEKKRKLYDEFGEMGLRDGFNPNMARGYGRRGGGAGGAGGPSIEDLFGGGGAAGGGGIGDMLGDLFGGGGRGRRRPQKAQDVQSEVTIDFVSAVRGSELEFSVQDGTLKKVRIPPGAQDGDKLRVKGGGGRAAPHAPASDLILELRVKKHPHFQREGLDLTLELPLSIGEAYLGAKIEVPTTDGTVQLKVPPHAQSGQVLRLRQKGVTRGKKTGDLYVRFMIQMPTSEDVGEDKDGKLKEAIELLDAAMTKKNELRQDMKF